MTYFCVRNMEYLNYIKSLHIIFVVTWFAGLFYMVRLLIYHTESNHKAEPDRSILIKEYIKNERPLWFGIAWPSAVLTVVFGIWLVSLLNYWTQIWMLVKFGMVIGLIAYHFSVGYLYKQIKKGNFKYSSMQLRIWNEVATLFLVSIVFIITVKSAISWIWGLVGIVVFSVVLMIAIKRYKAFREKKKNHE